MKIGTEIVALRQPSHSPDRLSAEHENALVALTDRRKELLNDDRLLARRAQHGCHTLAEIRGARAGLDHALAASEEGGFEYDLLKLIGESVNVCEVAPDDGRRDQIGEPQRREFFRDVAYAPRWIDRQSALRVDEFQKIGIRHI